MSLMKLPTELRLMIFQNLDSAAVYRLMLTSKELRREAEPCLYQNISIIRPDRLQYLLVKILNRRELIKHTRSFSLQVADPEGLLRSVEFSPEELASIRSVIEEFNEEWLEFDSKAPIRELSLSLVLCLAINLEELHLVFAGGHIKHYYMLSRFLATDWLMCQSYNDGLPFRKLQTFSLDTRSDKAGYEDLDQMIPRSTSLQNIFLSNLPVNKIISEFFDPHLRMAFHTLALDNVESELYEIHGILKQPCFQHLKRLVIKNLPYKYIRRGRLPRPMRLLKTSGTLSEVIVQNLPELEELEISNVRIRAKERRGLCKDFDLGNHQNLTKLVIDYDLLATDKLPHTEICLLNSEQVLPPRLRSMTLTGVNECSLKILLGLYENYSKDPGRAATFISALFRVDGIREFDLELQLWKEKIRKPGMGTDVLSLLYGVPLSGYAQQMIPRLIETLQGEKETKMHIWRQDHEYGKMLLYSSGYTPSESFWYERDHEDAPIWYKWGDEDEEENTSLWPWDEEYDGENTCLLVVEENDEGNWGWA